MIKIGFYQFNPKFKRVNENCTKIINKLNGVKADVIVLPELAFTGYNFHDRKELESVAEDPADSNIVKEVTNLCSRNDFYIITGFAEKFGQSIFNSALLIGPEGLVHIYRKIHLFNREKLYFNPGDRPLAINTIKGTKIGIMICFDWIFPEIARSLAILGAEVICQPANLVLSYCQNVMLARSLENRVFSVTANRIGKEIFEHGSLEFTGQSQIVAPNGDLLYRANSKKELIYIHDIEQKEASNKNITKLNNIFVDRRPDFYKPLCT